MDHIIHEHLDLAIVLKGNVDIIADDKAYRFSVGQSYFIYSEYLFEITIPKYQVHSVIWCHTGHITIPDEIKSELKALPVSATP